MPVVSRPFASTAEEVERRIWVTPLPVSTPERVNASAAPKRVNFVLPLVPVSVRAKVGAAGGVESSVTCALTMVSLPARSRKRAYTVRGPSPVLASVKATGLESACGVAPVKVALSERVSGAAARSLAAEATVNERGRVRVLAGAVNVPPGAVTS